MILEIIGAIIIAFAGLIVYAKNQYDNGLSKFSEKNNTSNCIYYSQLEITINSEGKFTQLFEYSFNLENRNGFNIFMILKILYTQ